jgi:hypothetical protein
MPQHRGLTRRKFVDAVGTVLMREYLETRIELADDIEDLADNVVSELLDSQSPEVRKNVEEEFYCINDIADRGMDYLERACQDYSVPLNPDWPRERVAMNLFVNSPSAFRAAYDWYLWRTSANSMSHHQFMDVNPDFSDEARSLFQGELDSLFTAAKKGSSPSTADGAMCDVRYYQDDDDHIMVVSHGDYLHTHTIWRNGNVATSVYRPAKEDVIRYSEANGILSLKLSSRNLAQRRGYVDSFGRCVLGLEEVPLDAFESTTVSLEPIRSGTFNYWGNDQIESVTVVAADIEFPQIKASVSLRSGDLVETVTRHLADLQFSKGILKYAKLNFHLKYDGAPTRPVPVEIRPPQRTIISRKRDADVIESYLRENQVLLG